ncbi:MAG TPA: flippase [Candidatus Binatia bacterium]|jgi:O-antigen/teichoic acid export membrane protein|nr:flippase [Candidatus Binatia bacterium]
MSVSRAVASNTVVQVAGKFAGNVLGIITIAIMTRALGRDGYGAFTTAISFLQFFGILVDFGLTLTMVRMISEERADVSRVASNIFTLRIVSGAVFFGLAPVLALAFPYPPQVKTAIAIGALSFFAMTSSQVLTGVFQKHLATGRAALADVLGRAALLLGAWHAAARGAGLLAFVAAFVLGNVVQLTVTFIAARKFARIRPAFDLGFWRKIVRESWPIGVSIAFNLIYLKGDVIILSLTRTQGEVGLYGAAYKVLDVITVIPMIFMGLVLPLLSSAWSGGRKDEFGRKLGKAFDALSLLALPLAFGTFAVASDLMAFVAGPQFAASGPFLAILMLAGAAVFWSALFGHTVVAIGLQRKMIFAYAADAALSLALYVWAVPRYGGPGAAWVTVFSEAFIMVATAWAVIAATGVTLKLRTFLRAALASALMAAAVASLASLHVLLRVAVGAAVYAALLAIFGILNKETLSFLRKPNAASTGPVLQ